MQHLYSQFSPSPLDELYTQESQPELYCLAQNIYFEAKSEPLAGQYAVADVVLNRVNDTRYPNTICEVVYEGPIKESWKTKQDPDLPENERVYYPKRNQCQFSWIVMVRQIQSQRDAWRTAQIIAYRILINQHRGLTEGSTSSADYVAWAKSVPISRKNCNTYILHSMEKKHIDNEYEVPDDLPASLVTLEQVMMSHDNCMGI